MPRFKLSSSTMRRISSRSSGEMPMTRGSSGNVRLSLGTRYSVRSDTAPDISIEWRVPAGTPHTAMNRDDPCALRRAHRHHSLRRIDQLMPRMRMRLDNVAVGVFEQGVGPDLVLVRVKKPVALF